MASIADVFFKALLEDKQLQIDAVKAGDKAGQSMGERMGKGVGFAMKAGLGLVSAGAALATKGMVELDDITAQFTADTGASADEAARARKAINEMAGRNLQPMREIGAALGKVHTDLGLTGEAAEKTTEQFLKFATVTKRDAAEEVASFDDILDAYGKTAADIPGIMDKLIASHQEYGGAIAEDEAALAAMAPQLKAFNLGIDDGIALLDLFKSSGLDAATVPKALNSAIQKLDGRPLTDFLKELTGIEDPMKRAQRASEIFGSKAGPLLANALKPGIGSLEDFRITTEAATGATDKAADAIESTFGNRAQLLLKGFTSKLIEVGDNFGPVLTGIASLASLGGALGLSHFASDFVDKMADAGKAGGQAFIDASSTAVGTLGTVFGNIIAKVIDPTEKLLGDPLRAAATKAGVLWSATFAAATRLANAIGDLLLAIPGVQRVVTAVVASGRAIGTLFAGAIVAAIPLVLVGGIVDAFNEGKDKYKGTAEQVGTDIAAAMAAGNIEELGRQRDKIAAAIKEALGDADVGGFDPFRAFRTLGSAGDINKLQTELDKINAFIANYSADHPATVEVHPKLGPPLPANWGQHEAEILRQQMLAAGKLVAEAFLSSWSDLPLAERIVGMGHDVRQAAANLTLSLAAGLRSGRGNIDAALAQLREDMKNRLSPRKEVALRIGQLFSRALAKGLHDIDPLIKKQAEGTRALIEDQLIETVKAGGDAGRKIQEELERKLKSKDPAVRAQAKRTKELIDAALKARSQGKTPGDAIGDQLNADLANSGTQLGRTAYNLGRQIFRNLMAGVEGTGPVSSGGAHGPARKRQHGGPVTAGEPYIVGEKRPEWFVPNTSGRIVASPVSHAVTNETTVGPISISVDARGAANPQATGAAVRQGVADAMADIFRQQTARLPVGTRA